MDIYIILVNPKTGLLMAIDSREPNKRKTFGFDVDTVVGKLVALVLAEPMPEERSYKSDASVSCITVVSTTPVPANPVGPPWAITFENGEQWTFDTLASVVPEPYTVSAEEIRQSILAHGVKCPVGWRVNHQIEDRNAWRDATHRPELSGNLVYLRVR